MTETKKMIPFTVASNRIKYLGINSTKEVKDLHTESCKILIKDTEEDTNKWKDILGTWTGRIVKIANLLKVIYRFNVILIKIQTAFYTF